MTEIYLSTN